MNAPKMIAPPAKCMDATFLLLAAGFCDISHSVLTTLPRNCNGPGATPRRPPTREVSSDDPHGSAGGSREHLRLCLLPPRPGGGGRGWPGRPRRADRHAHRFGEV